ncbi:unnamed protein product [Acanthoscelides obtectus]|uniref:Uncharacterized protein n=1 Tax=Acanthoscelides obtectus TaxID=200917 RepID=A0A9P0KE08_ACAOB|nr:unnamed protein product [Acanthoscelides obtectus]CAK1624801.1 hypothetical protein AOBTE_LOCUS2770 [Acanthoscelides obtectus]
MTTSNECSARVFCIVLETEISFFKYREEISFYIVNLFCTVLSTGVRVRSVTEKCELSIVKTLTSFREISEVIRILRLVQVYVRR